MDKTSVLQMVDRWPHQFRDDFKGWLDANFHIWIAFSKEADRLYARGRRHYSARTIIEWLRHETALSQSPQDFKINGNFVPDLARLWRALHPERSDFFETRIVTKKVRAA